MIRILIRHAQNVGRVMIRSKKKLLTLLGYILALFPWAGTSKDDSFLGVPRGSPCCYPPMVAK